MAVNTETTLVEIVKHKQLFFRLFDFCEAREGGGEFPAPVYNQLLRQSLASKSRVEARKLAETLDLDNLERNGLLIYFDKRASTFLMQPFVIDMLRQLDKSRLKELSDSDLQGMRKQLADVLALVSSTEFNWYSQDLEYKEAIAYIYETLRFTSSRIQQNIDALHGQSTHLAEIVDSSEHNRLSRAAQVRNALSRILQITERHIDPTLSFLDPNKQWQGDEARAPMQILSEILQRFEQRGRHEEYNQINRIQLNLLAQAERISHIRKSLSSYLNLFEQQRRIYNNIEARFNALHDKVAALQDGRLSGAKLKAHDEHFSAGKALHGIKDHRAAYHANIDWPNIQGRGLLDEALRIKLADLSQFGDSDVSTASAQDNDQERQERLRMQRLQQLAASIDLQPRSDVYQQIHQVLKAQSDYRLQDLLDAIAFTQGASHTLKLPKRLQIEHQGQSLQYFERHLIADAEAEPA